MIPIWYSGQISKETAKRLPETILAEISWKNPWKIYKAILGEISMKEGFKEFLKNLKESREIPVFMEISNGIFKEKFLRNP